MKSITTGVDPHPTSVTKEPEGAASELSGTGSPPPSGHRPLRHGTLRTICAWCRSTIQEGDSEEVSHGMCHQCLEKWEDE